MSKAISNQNSVPIKKNSTNSSVKQEAGKKTMEGANAPIEEEAYVPEQKAPSQPDDSPSKAGKDKMINVSPDIFVSLKKGIISDYYKIGKTLGEGKALLLSSIFFIMIAYLQRIRITLYI